MSRGLLITVRLHDGRYHGAGEWPPAPARLFQALVAGAGGGGALRIKDVEALRWLEGCSPPHIAAPTMTEGQRIKIYVPNNDLDAVGGDHRRVEKIRTEKIFKPRLFDKDIPWLYAWTFDENDESRHQADWVCALAERLYQFGRGVDMACASGEVLDNEDFEARLSQYPGVVYRPSSGGGGTVLSCPNQGTLASLEARYGAERMRFRVEGRGNASKQTFTAAPKPRFAQVAYGSPPSRRLYELRERTPEASFGVWPLAEVARLVVWLRCAAVRLLREALPDRSAEIERVLVGRKADGADDGPTSLRVRIVPLPSIGHRHSDSGIRRVVVDVPAGCGIPADDVHWAFSGLDVVDPETGEVLEWSLTPSEDERMLAHYGIGDSPLSLVWRSVTPVALPDRARRRRIAPERRSEEAKSGSERAAEEVRAAGAVVQALRHAEVRARVEAIRVQREPFEANGERVERFAPGTRFAKERLWHVEVTLSEAVAGPLVIGDGRFLGLGIMAPVGPSTTSLLLGNNRSAHQWVGVLAPLGRRL